MGQKKKVTWNSGQTPDRPKSLNIPIYTPEPDVEDVSIRDSWNSIDVGHICIAMTDMFAVSSPARQSRESKFPFPVLYSGNAQWGGELQVKEGQMLIYLGQTYVNCLGSKNRIISRPYKTVFFNGSKYLLSDPNNLKPLME